MKKFKVGQTMYLIWAYRQLYEEPGYFIERAQVTNEPPRPDGYQMVWDGKIPRTDVNRVIEHCKTTITVSVGGKLVEFPGIYRSRRKAERACRYLNQIAEWEINQRS